MSDFRTPILATMGFILLLSLVNTIEAATPALASVMNSGNLWSCAQDNQAQGLSLCASTSVVIYRLLAESDPDHDYYLVYFTVGRGNSTLATYVTEVFVDAEIPRPASLGGSTGPSPVDGCNEGSTDVVWHWGLPFNIGGVDGCTELNFTSTTESFFVNWHICAGIPLCPYGTIFRDYTGFLFGMAVPEGEPALFTLHTKTTVAKPSSCCFRDLLATSEVVWSPQSPAQSVASLTPPPQFLGQWYLIVAGVVALTGVPFFTWRASRRGPFLPSPQGVEIISFVNLALGLFLVLSAGRTLPFSLSSLGVSLFQYPLLGIFLGTGVLVTALGLWLGQEWAWTLTVLGNALSIVRSLIDLASLNPIQWVASLLSISLAVYVIGYLIRPEVKAYFAKTSPSATPTPQR